MAPAEPFEWLLWQIGYSVCHQMGDRSFFVDGHQFPIDARMGGIFLGFLITTAYLVVMGRWDRPLLPDRLVLAAALIGSFSMLVDGASSYSGLRETTNALRLATGLGMGAAVGVLLPPVWRAISSRGAQPRGGSPVATWIDLPVIYGLLFVVGAAVYSTRAGLWFFYLLGGAMIVGHLVLFHLAVRMLTVSLLAPRFPALRPIRAHMAFAVVAQSVLTGLLWAGHIVVDSLAGTA